MKDLVDVALAVQALCLSNKWKFCFIGGLAVQYWGEPRLTRDVDLSLLTGFKGEEVFIDLLLNSFDPRIDQAKEFALENRVLLLKTKTGIGIDVAFAALPFEEVIIDRAKDQEISTGKHVRLCSAEDLIILKAFASRPIDWRDVEMIIARQGRENLDWNYIERNLAELVLLKEEPEILARLQKLKTK